MACELCNKTLQCSYIPVIQDAAGAEAGLLNAWLHDLVTVLLMSNVKEALDC